MFFHFQTIQLLPQLSYRISVSTFWEFRLDLEWAAVIPIFDISYIIWFSEDQVLNKYYTINKIAYFVLYSKARMRIPNSFQML